MTRGMDSKEGPPARRARGRRVARIGGMVVLFLVLLFAAKRTGDVFVERSLRSAPSAAPLRIEAQPVDAGDSYTIERFSFEGAPGERVPVIGVVPAAAGRRVPAIIFLYGIGMKMGFQHEIAKAVADSGCAIFVPEQYGRGERAVARRALPLQVLQVRRRLALTVLETRRLVNVLRARPDIDPDGICLWGVSLGAMTGCSAMAYDRRIAMGIFTGGGGDLPRIALDSPFLNRPGARIWERPLALIAAEVLRPFDPVRHAGRIAPRPVLFQNASRDEIFPRASVEALFDAAGQPKNIHWFDSPHDRPTRETVEALLRDGLEWLRSRRGAAP